ncbi:E3 ubiquitin-protein ligase RING1-like [Lolium perenne]|uniref:E3 ubiquitin-protein ligase RING1-like n=1 Tax=Lolium perenne TaxID=4522 RepID=UPI0021F5B29C|nr:E3 ubiquitin-protein ligase RING1-like [Lolium perenne]
MAGLIVSATAVSSPATGMEDVGYGIRPSHIDSLVASARDCYQLRLRRRPYGGGRFGAVPASEAEIARLPKATAGEVREKDCAVCLESFQEGEEMRKMTCPGSHCFHESCILKWLRVSRLCPMCRFALPPEHEGHLD